MLFGNFAFIRISLQFIFKMDYKHNFLFLTHHPNLVCIKTILEFIKNTYQIWHCTIIEVLWIANDIIIHIVNKWYILGIFKDINSIEV
jgi:hypothetical protein